MLVSNDFQTAELPWNPFAHFHDLPISNVFGGDLFGLPHQDTMQLPDGATVGTAVPGHPETVRYYIADEHGVYMQASLSEVQARNEWLQDTYDANVQLVGVVFALVAAALDGV